MYPTIHDKYNKTTSRATDVV